MDAAEHFIFKTLPPSVFPVFVVYLINALNDLCGKTLDILSFYSAIKKIRIEQECEGRIKKIRRED